jgi:hypothetical protein
LLLVILVLFKVVLFKVHAMGPGFLPLLEAPTKIDFMVSHVGPSAVVPEFQVSPKVGALKCAVSFWETKSQGVKSGM